jgi:hypothetical protein
MNQIEVLPLESRQRMSDLWSPLKSPAPATLSVSGTAPSPAIAIGVAPFMSHTERLPLVSSHKMSPMPSPLKSPVATTDQLGSGDGMPEDDRTCVPFMNQMAVSPAVSRHKRSVMPSPLKSRWPTIDQLLGTLPRPPVELTVAPFISHAARLPLLSRHNRSLLPSPLKSWVLARHKVLARLVSAVVGARDVSTFDMLASVISPRRVRGMQEALPHGLARRLRDDADITDMGAVALLERQTRIVVRCAVRLGVPEGPERAAAARSRDDLAGVPAERGQVPADIGAYRRLAQHRGKPPDLGLVAVGIDLRRVDRQHLGDVRRLDGRNSRLVRVVLLRSEVIDEGRIRERSGIPRPPQC